MLGISRYNNQKSQMKSKMAFHLPKQRQHVGDQEAVSYSISETLGNTLPCSNSDGEVFTLKTKHQLQAKPYPQAAPGWHHHQC
mmetsp:Transcript_41581/g.70178  ORF Transcript_41581/g.70178 Transcript_41581/m.70178 type:complete len:83 (+) Transcript_41581:325-573(+)